MHVVNDQSVAGAAAVRAFRVLLCRRQPLNAPLLVGIICAVAFLRHDFFLFDREVAMLVLAAISMKFTARPIREGNHFNFYPINEVAVLFFGIFLTMIPAIELLRIRGAARRRRPQPHALGRGRVRPGRALRGDDAI